jgi:hypothetical protein
MRIIAVFLSRIVKIRVIREIRAKKCYLCNQI